MRTEPCPTEAKRGWALVSVCLLLCCGIAGCGGGPNTPPPPPAAADFALSVSPTSVSVVQGGTSAPVTVSVAGTNGFSGTVSVAISGLPAGASASPASPLNISANSSQQFTVTAAADTPTGNLTLKLHGTSGSLAHDAAVSLTTNPRPQTSESGGVLYLQSYSSGHTARIGLNTAWGGSIVEVSLDGTNFVNAHDTGREVQPSLYDGAAKYDNCAGCSGTFGWNPVLGGDRYDHGSPVLAQQLASDSLYVKAWPLEWYPDNKGGGPNTPVESDAYFEETVSVAPGAPLAFKVHFKLTHFGTDQHYNAFQEFPAVYVNSSYGTLVYYGGTSPWANGAVTQTPIPTSPGTGNLYSSEQWAACVDSNNLGLTVFVPDQYPYESAGSFPGSGGSGPTGDATYSLHPFTMFTVGAGAVIEGDVYLIPGDYAAARNVVYGLHKTLPSADIFTPIGNVDTPSASATISGSNVQISGWAIDNVAVSKVEIFVDGTLKGSAPLAVDRPDVVAAYPNLAPLMCGWAFSLDSTKLTNGAHTITLHVTDTANNVAVFPPVSVTVSN